MSAMKIEIDQLNKCNDERLKKEISSQLEFIMEQLLEIEANGENRNYFSDLKHNKIGIASNANRHGVKLNTFSHEKD